MVLIFSKRENWLENDNGRNLNGSVSKELRVISLSACERLVLVRLQYQHGGFMAKPHSLLYTHSTRPLFLLLY
jgi:hypothetical protein